MTDTQHLKEQCDLRRMVEQDLGPAPLRGERAYLWKCPFHNEQKGYSLAVWTDGYRCFGACDTSGDALDWLMNYRRLSFPEAASVLGQRIDDRPRVKHQCLKSPSEPPEWSWQRRAECVVSQAEETLWSDVGEPALNYLIGRGLATRTIRCEIVDGHVAEMMREIQVDPELMPVIREAYTQEIAEKLGHLRLSEQQELEAALKAVDEEEARAARLYAAGKITDHV